MAEPDPRPRKRVTASSLEWSEFHRVYSELDMLCQVCRHAPWEELHHIVPRAQSGDDVYDNLMPLCAPCHLGVTENRIQALMLLRWALTPAQRFYVAERKGIGWLEAKYPAVMAL